MKIQNILTRACFSAVFLAAIVFFTSENNITDALVVALLTFVLSSSTLFVKHKYFVKDLK